MISIEEAIQIHEILIQQFGGARGIRDRALLQSALIRPFQQFGGTELYPSPEEKAAAILESIIVNHPFIDGNKRIGYVLMKLIILEAGFQITADHIELFDFIIKVASGKLEIKQITSWIEDHVIH